MSFFKFLQGIGDKLGILETVSASEASSATRIQTRIVSLRDLATEIRSGEVHALADSPEELAVPFETIFETAGISSNPDNWTILRLAELVARAASPQKSREQIQKDVLESLNSEGVSAETIIKDAMARDQALDAFEATIEEKIRKRGRTLNARLLEIEAHIKSLQEESAKIGRSLQTDEEQWRRWKKLKRSREREMASAASYIVDRDVITTDDNDTENT